MNPDPVRLVRDSRARVTSEPHASTTQARHAAAWLFATLLAAAAGPSQAAAVYAEHWDGGLSTQGWYANSGQADVLPNAVVGQPPGSIASVYIGPDGSPGRMIGAASGNLELIGSYHGQTWQVSFDALLAEGPVEAFWLRYRVYDTPGGWRLPLAVPTPGVWTHYAIGFDPSWTDEQAVAAGWEPEEYVWDWGTSMGYVTGTELRMQLADADTTTTALAYFDNFVQQHDGTVPAPATVMLALLGLAGTVAARRRPFARAGTAALKSGGLAFSLGQATRPGTWGVPFRGPRSAHTSV